MSLLSALGYFLLAALIPASFPFPRLRLAAAMIALYAAVCVSGKAVEWLWLKTLRGGAARGLKSPRHAVIALIAALFLLCAASSLWLSRFESGCIALMTVLLALVAGSVVATMGGWLYQGWNRVRAAIGGAD